MICLDSSVVVKLILDEEDSASAHALYNSLIPEKTPIVAPLLLPIEITNVLRQRTRGQNAISLSEAAALLEIFPTYDGSAIFEVIDLERPPRLI